MHFTYASPDKSQLKQGDIISKRSAIHALLEEYYPYWAEDQNYTHLMVISQTCDLVRRNGNPCKTHWINVAAVKPLGVVLNSQIKGYQDTDFMKAAGVYPLNERGAFRRFLQRLHNNNEVEYFYLHQEPSVKFMTNSCAFLRISATLRRDHYDVLLENKVVQLTPVFQAKLGWMVGTIYSRVGTGDWVPNKFESTREFTNMLDGIVEGTCNWLDRSRIKNAERKWKQANKPQDTEQFILQEIKRKPQLTLRERVVEDIISALREKDVIEESQVIAIREMIHGVDEIRNLR